MKKLFNQQGITLMTALLFTMICLVMMLGLMQILITATQGSGSRKSYHNSLESAYGGVELVTREFIPRLYQNYSTGLGPLLSTFGGNGGNGINLTVNKESLKLKLAKPTAEWGPLSRSPDAKEAPDLQFLLKGSASQNRYRIYVKIVETVPGNSDNTGTDFIDSGSGVTGDGAGIAMKHTPTFYTLEVQGESAVNPEERAMLSVLYAY
jgi:hypothetical protein